MQFSDLKGFGEKRIQTLQAAGINTPADLVSYFPTRYIDTKNLSNLALAEEGQRVVILACTHDTPKVFYPRRGLSIVKVKFTYDSASVYCSWFNQPYMAKNIIPKCYYYIEGKLKKNKSTYEIVAPQLIKFTGNEPPVIPVYKSIGKVSSALIADAVKKALSMGTVRSHIPPYLCQKYNLSPVHEAIMQLHFPDSMVAVSEAKRVLSIERMSYMLTAYAIINRGRNDGREKIYSAHKSVIKAMTDSLPFTLTGAQENAVDSVLNTLKSEQRLNVLLQGDVGSGKTAVAFLSMFFAAKNGYQSALLAPTEILAYQHYQRAVKLFEKLGLRCAYLSSSVKKAERENVLYGLSTGAIDCIFGTHALLSDDVTFCDLSLVVVDEQHRFGVAQRAKMENKTRGVDVIVMSATPIPRTLALTLYGDLQQITLNELPRKKAKTVTRFVTAAKEKDMWQYILDRAKLGEQTFVVAPRIDSDDEEKNSAQKLFDEHKRDCGGDIALLHGKMKDSVKTATMQDFADGKIKVIVATTVIEVGIDVPNATTMVIYDADRFGLSQLHQLRGRVGRGEKDAFCFVLSDSTVAESRDRLQRFMDTDSGFELAEYDFISRGAGDFLGYSQHGDNGFCTDSGVIALAKNISDDMLVDSAAVDSIRATISENKYEFFSGITLN